MHVSKFEIQSSVYRSKSVRDILQIWGTDLHNVIRVGCVRNLSCIRKCVFRYTNTVGKYTIDIIAMFRGSSVE